MDGLILTSLHANMQICDNESRKRPLCHHTLKHQGPLLSKGVMLDTLDAGQEAPLLGIPSVVPLFQGRDGLKNHQGS